MENLALIKPRADYCDEIMAYRKEFENTKDRMNGSGGLEHFDSPLEWIENCRLYEKRETLPKPDAVEGEQYMLVRQDDRKLLGLISFRHYFNSFLEEYGGHIGYSVRPTERRKGYAGKMLKACLDKCREYGLERVLITCMTGNEASRKTIIAAGGVYERTTRLEAENVDMERYWLSLYPLRDYYTSYNEDGRLLSRRGSVEFLTTTRYIERYLKPGSRILDIGAGTGRYSLALADKGFEVDAVELLEHNIGIFRANIKAEQKLTIRQGNVLDLSFIPDDSYDITLLLGPMYHLYNFDDKRRALSETLRVTKPGGVVFAAYCVQDSSVIQYGFMGGHMDEILAKKLIDPVTFKVISNPSEVFELCRKEDIKELMSAFTIEPLHYVATDLYTNYMKNTIEVMDDKTFTLYLNYHFSICERPDMTGITNHSLDIFRKP